MNHGNGKMGRLLTLQEVLDWLQISKSNWYDGVRRNVYPQPVRIGTRTVRWQYDDIYGYLKQNGLAND